MRFLASASNSLASSILSASSRDLPISCPCALRKVYAMPPPMISAVDLVQQILNDADLVADLRAAQNGDERLLRMLSALPRYFSSFSMSRPAADCCTNW